MPEQPRGDGVAVWALFLRTHAALVRRLDQELVQATGLPLSWYDVLLELNAVRGHRLRMGELGERVVLSRSRVSRVVDELARKGLVVREPDPADGRGAMRSSPTPGESPCARVPRLPGRDRRALHQHFTDGQRAAIQAALTRVLQSQQD